MVDIQSATAEIRRGKKEKKRRKEEETTWQKYNVRMLRRAAIKTQKCCMSEAVIISCDGHAVVLPLRSLLAICAIAYLMLFL